MKITTFRLLSRVATASGASKSGVSASKDNMLARIPVGDPKKDPLPSYDRYHYDQSYYDYSYYYSHY